jgi:DNA-binding SARP family transcriptional activator
VAVEDEPERPIPRSATVKHNGIDTDRGGHVESTGPNAAMPTRSRTRHARPLLTLFDTFELRLDDRELKVCSSAQLLIAALALRGPLSRFTVASLLWPEAAESRAHGNLRTALWRLSKVCPGLVLTKAEKLHLRPVDLDVDVFVRWAKGLAGGAVPVDDDVDFAQAGRLELLPGWYEDWVISERESLRQLRLHALEALARSLGDRGRYGTAIEVALAAIQLDPLRESAHRTLISLYIAEDNLSEAARHLRVLTRLLHAELGIAPSRQTIELVTARAPAVAMS